MIESTQLHRTALNMFVDDTMRYVAGVLDLATAIKDDDEVTAALLLVYTRFVSKSALAALRRASEQQGPSGI